jgi:hypothetical protein
MLCYVVDAVTMLSGRVLSANFVSLPTVGCLTVSLSVCNQRCISGRNATACDFVTDVGCAVPTGVHACVFQRVPHSTHTDKHLFAGAGCFAAVAALCSYGQTSQWPVVCSALWQLLRGPCVHLEGRSHHGGTQLQQPGVLHSMCIAPVHRQFVTGFLMWQLLYAHSSMQRSFVICPQPQTMLGELVNCTLSCCYSVLHDLL